MYTQELDYASILVCYSHYALGSVLLPSRFMDITIVRLVKNKSGDLTDVNNYRAITLSNAMTKILEIILLSKISYSKECDNYQFGFKKGH